ncbi:MAG: XisH protein, partial [Cyanobacteriota bacterium]
VAVEAGHGRRAAGLQDLAKDVFHEVVKIALQKDGWEITNDPLK